MTNKKILIISLLTLLLFCIPTGCSGKKEETAGDETQVEDSNEAVQEKSGTKEQVESLPWANGVYISENDEHLIIYETSVENGYEKDGWGAMYMIAEKMFSGYLDNKDGALSGELAVYTEDGSEGEKISVTLINKGDYVLFRNGDGEEIRFDIDNNDYSDPNFIPMFYYNGVYAGIGYDPLQAAVYDYLALDYPMDQEIENTVIPYATIVDIDEKDPENVLLYGDFYVYEVQKEDDVLVVVNTRHCPGIIHMTRIGEDETAIYEETGEMTAALSEEEEKNVFGEYYEHYKKLASDTEMREAGTAQVFADYVSANSLEITKYRLEGGSDMELPDSKVGRVSGEAGLPPYEYPGPEIFYSILYQYLIDEFGGNYNAADVCIPCPMIIKIDDSDKDDIRVYGDFMIFNYFLTDDILECDSGGSYPGCIHIKYSEEGYEITKTDLVEDGSGYQESAKRIFGEYYEDFKKVVSDDKAREKIRAQIIANYVAANNLHITAYKDFGWDPIELPEENIDSFSNSLY